MYRQQIKMTNVDKQFSSLLGEHTVQHWVAGWANYFS